MAEQSTGAGTQPRRFGRSVLAVLLGLVAIFVLSLGTDEVLHLLRVYPPWGEPMLNPGLNLLAFAYRFVFDVFGCFLAARFAPRAPMGHALALGVIGLVLSAGGVAASLKMPELGPLWYPVALLISTLPCAWIGGAIARRRAA